jgi:hypothetical protein
MEVEVKIANQGYSRYATLLNVAAESCQSPRSTPLACLTINGRLIY